MKKTTLYPQLEAEVAVTSGDPEVDKLVGLVKGQVIREAAAELRLRLAEVDNKLASSGLRGGIAAGARLKAYVDHINTTSDRLLTELLGIAREANGGLLPREATAWMVSSMTSFVEGMGRGLATRVGDDRDARPKEHHLEELERATQAKASDVKQRIAYLIGMDALAARNSSVAETTSASQSADRDVLTPLFNKAAFERDFKAMVAEALVEAYPLALIMSDGDGLKRVNDEHGHDVGDGAIKGLGEVIWRRMRKRGNGYRFGGDEFAMLLPNHTVTEARDLAEAIRGEIERSSFTSLQLKLTATFGVAACPIHAQDSTGLFRAADQALVTSKKQGRRNCVAVALSPESEIDHG